MEMGLDSNLAKFSQRDPLPPVELKKPERGFPRKPVCVLTYQWH